MGENERICWLAQSGKEYEQADRESLRLSEDEAEVVVDSWKESDDNPEERWYNVVRMRATPEGTPPHVSLD